MASQKIELPEGATLHVQVVCERCRGTGKISRELTHEEMERLVVPANRQTEIPGTGRTRRTYHRTGYFKKHQGKSRLAEAVRQRALQTNEASTKSLGKTMEIGSSTVGSIINAKYPLGQTVVKKICTYLNKTEKELQSLIDEHNSIADQIAAKDLATRAANRK